jgi:hypothetical protein
MHDDRVLGERIRPAAHGDAVPLEIAAWHVEGEPVPVAEALAASYQPFSLGAAWGRPWGYLINLPPRGVPGQTAVEPLVAVDNPAVVVEAVKLAEDQSGDIVVRLYESLGGRATARLTAGFPLGSATLTDLLERTIAACDTAGLSFRPFEIKTLRLTRASASVRPKIVA